MHPDAKTVGIAACSGPGAALCYETITTESQELLGPHHHPEIILHAFSFGAHVRLLEEGDWPGIGTLMGQSADKLANSGAHFLICPDNTVHEALPHLPIGTTTLPWLHIAEAVAQEAHRRQFRKLAILGTRYLMEGPVYPEKLEPLSIASVTPNAEERAEINDIIFDHLTFGRIREEDLTRLQQIINRLQSSEQCDAVVLGCTELPLILNDENSPLPTLDSTRILARAAIHAACR